MQEDQKEIESKNTKSISNTDNKIIIFQMILIGQNLMMILMNMMLKMKMIAITMKLYFNKQKTISKIDS